MISFIVLVILTVIFDISYCTLEPYEESEMNNGITNKNYFITILKYEININ
jgi:hypothetical protein